MNHFDPPSLSLMMSVKALMNQSSGTIEEISREVLVAVAAFLQDQGTKSDCGGINNPDGFAAAAKKEYEDLVSFRKHFDDLEKNRDTKKIPPVLSREVEKKKCINCDGGYERWRNEEDYTVCHICNGKGIV